MLENESKWQEINRIAAENASLSLSKLLNKKVQVSTIKMESGKLETFSSFISLEEVAAGIYLPATGDIAGAALLVFPKEDAFAICDLLLKRETNTDRTVTELDESVLKEVGNIFTGSYFAVLSNILQVNIMGDMPSVSFNISGAIIVGKILAAFSQKVESVLCMEIKFTIELTTLNAYLLLMFNLDDIRRREELKQLEQFHKLTIGREIKNIELKAEVNCLLEKLGKKPFYDNFIDEKTRKHINKMLTEDKE